MLNHRSTPTEPLRRSGVVSYTWLKQLEDDTVKLGLGVEDVTVRVEDRRASQIFCCVSFYLALFGCVIVARFANRTFILSIMRYTYIVLYVRVTVFSSSFAVVAVALCCVFLLL